MGSDLSLDTSHLQKPQSPWIVRLSTYTADGALLARRLAELDLTARVLDATRMRTKAGLLDEFASRLGFPDYFGRNWDALSECLADLEWLEGTGYAIVIEHAECLLEAEPPALLELFLGLVDDVAAEWAEPVARGEWWDRPGRPFHLLLRLHHDGAGDAGVGRQELVDRDEITVN